MKQTTVSFGERLKHFRLEHGWTAAQCAEALLVSARTVHRWEQGMTTPRQAIFIRLAALTTAFDDLLNTQYLESSAEFSLSHKLIESIHGVGIEMIKRLAKYPADLKHFDRRLFEELIAEIWDGFGYSIDLTSRTRDGGKDIIAIGGQVTTDKFLIECKRPDPENPVRISPVRELYAVKVDEGATKAILATTTRFTQDAQKFIDRHKWEMEGRDYDGILAWIDQYIELKQGRTGSEIIV